MLNHEGKLDQPVKVYRNLRHTWGIVEVQSHAGEITRWQEMTSRETEKIEIWTNQWDVFIMKATVWRIKNTSETHGSNSRELSPMSQISDPAGDHKGKVRISQKSRFILWGPWIIAITTNLPRDFSLDEWQLTDRQVGVLVCDRCADCDRYVWSARPRWEANIFKEFWKTTTWLTVQHFMVMTH